jgi:hypothetical protein
VTSRASYLLERIAALKQVTDDPWHDEDVEEVGLEVAEFIRDALDVPSLERELVSRARVDTSSLLEVVRRLEALGDEEPPPFDLKVAATATPIDWRTRLDSLKNVTASLDTAERLETLEILLRLNLVADGAIDALLVALPVEHVAKKDVEQRVRQKLDLLSDEKALEFWAQLRFQVDPSRATHYELDDGIAPRSFFDLGDAKDVRDRVARYLAYVRPALERKMIERGVDRFPAGLSGIASVLSWTSEPATTEWGATEQTVIRALGRLALLWIGEKDVLAKALGLLPEGYFLGGRGEQEAKRTLERALRPKAPRPGRLLDELAKLVRVAEVRRVHLPGTVERVLRAFKLGLEVTAEDHLAELRKRDELYFQRQLLRFLVERDIPAYGTKFGRSEVDVRADDPLGAIVVETKLLKGSLSETTLNRWLTQLGSYMDEAHVALRGSLVIFNFGDAPILCPVMALRFRYLLVAVNLCGPSPSKRKAGIEIEETPAGPGVVRVLRLGKEQQGQNSRKTLKRK